MCSMDAVAENVGRGRRMNRLLDEQAVVDVVDFECGEWRGLAKTIVEKIEQLPSAQPEQRWIPCSERLPEKCGEYLVTREARGVYRYLDIVKKTNISGQIASDIIAWMPLPEPYWE